MHEELWHIVEAETLRSVGPTSCNPGMLYEWARRDGYEPGTVAVMRLRGGLKRCEQSRATVAHEARRYARELAEQIAEDVLDDQ